MEEGRTSEKNKVNGWAILDSNGIIYYSCQNFFGISMDKEFIRRNGLLENESKIISGDCNDDTWWEIAQQLYAMKEGWV